VFYYWQTGSTIFMLTVYAKSEQEDLKPNEKKQLKALIEALKRGEEE
jgi:hypothetical protein